MLEQLIDQAAEKLATAPSVVIFTGAGVSRESGVPTFRDALEGLWAQYDPTQLATPEAFRANPKLVWDFYQFRRDLVNQTQPNAGHYALAELESLLPKVVLVTQNIDQHHQSAGSRNIITLHGNLFAFKCAADCQGTHTVIEPKSLPPLPPDATQPPLCPHCKEAWARPDVVWFGESLPSTNLRRAFDEAQSCAVMLVIGTSAAVYPAALLPVEAAEKGATVIEINPNPSELSQIMDIRLEGPSAEILPQLLTALKARLGRA